MTEEQKRESMAALLDRVLEDAARLARRLEVGQDPDECLAQLKALVPAELQAPVSHEIWGDGRSLWLIQPAGDDPGEVERWPRHAPPMHLLPMGRDRTVRLATLRVPSDELARAFFDGFRRCAEMNGGSRR